MLLLSVGWVLVGFFIMKEARTGTVKRRIMFDLGNKTPLALHTINRTCPCVTNLIELIIILFLSIILE